MSQLENSIIKLNSSIGKFTLASLYANLDEPNTGETLEPLRDDSPGLKKKKILFKMAMDFEEEKHNRDDDGKFTSGGGSNKKDKEEKTNDEKDNLIITNEESEKITEGLKQFFPVVKEPSDQSKVFLTNDGEWIQLNEGSEHFNVLPAVTEKVVSKDKSRNVRSKEYLSHGLVRGGFEKDIVFINGGKPLNSKQKESLELVMIKKGLTSDNLIIEFKDEKYENKLKRTLNASLRNPFQLKFLLEKPTIDDLKNKLITKTKSKVAKLPGNQRLLLASLESITDDKKFASYFLLTGDMVNGRGWGVTAESIPGNINSFKGMPFVVTSNEFIDNSPYAEIYDHPSIEHLPMLGLAKPGSFDVNDETLIHRFQNKFRIGEIIDVFEKEGVWRCIIQIDEKFRSKPLPPFVSPSLLVDDPIEAMPQFEGKITKWHGLHLAGLNEKPAYGAIALLKGECQGPLGTCAAQLKNGSMGLRFDTNSRIKNAKGDEITFAGFSSVRELEKENEEDPNSYCFSHIEGPGIENKAKPMKLASCELAKITGPLKEAANKMKKATLISQSIQQTQKQNVIGCKKDKNGKCETKSKN